jgi:hypothetical protein
LLKATAAAAKNCLGLGGGGWIFFVNISDGSAARLTPLLVIATAVDAMLPSNQTILQKRSIKPS